MARHIKRKPFTQIQKEALEEISNRAKKVGLSETKAGPAWGYLMGTSATGRRSLQSQLRNICNWLGFKGEDVYLVFPWQILNASDISTILKCYDEKDYSKATRALGGNAVRGVLKEAWDRDLIDARTWSKIRDKKIGSGHSKKVTGRNVSNQEFECLLGICDTSTAPGARDAAMFAVMRGTAMRRGTLATVKIKELSEDEDGTWMIKSKTKGGGLHNFILPEDTWETLSNWIEFRGWQEGYLFSPISKSQRILVYRGLSAGSINKLMNKRIDQLLNYLEKSQDETEQKVFKEIKKSKTTPHDLRRTLLTQIIQNDGIAAASEIAGHASIDTTKRYDMSDIGYLKGVVKRTSVPKRKPLNLNKQNSVNNDCK